MKVTRKIFMSFYVVLWFCSEWLRAQWLTLTPLHNPSHIWALSYFPLCTKSSLNFGLTSVNHWPVLIGRFNLLFTSPARICVELTVWNCTMTTLIHFCKNRNEILYKYRCDCWTVVFSDFLEVSRPTAWCKKLFKTLFMLGVSCYSDWWLFEKSHVLDMKRFRKIHS